jgi:hypothetical protein
MTPTIIKGATNFERTKHVWLKLSELTAHPDIQRNFDARWATEIQKDFDPDKFGELSVVQKNGHYYIYDGQHRHAAAIKALGADQMVPCDVAGDLPVERVAQLSLGRNKTKHWKALDTWRARLHAKDPTAHAVERILQDHGLRTHTSRGAWGMEPDAFDQRLIRGMGMFCRRFDEKLVDDAELACKLSRNGGPGYTIGRSRDTAKLTGISVPSAVFELIVNVYNRGRRSKRLTAR